MNKKIILCVAALLGAALCLNAQSFQEGFLLRKYNLAYQYNPAIIGNNNFVGGGQVILSKQNNVGAGDFMYPTDDGLLVTGFHSSIPATTFPGELPDDMAYRGDLSATLFAYGFATKNAFHTIQVNVRGLYGASAPNEMLLFLKQGPDASAYDISGMHVDAGLFAEASYGYARQLTDWLSIGGRAKLLLPLYGARFDLTRLEVTTNTNTVQVDLRGDLAITNHLGKFMNNDNGHWDLKEISKKEAGGPLSSGAGIGFDLGLLATPADGLSISLSVLDLGAIFWRFGNRAAMGGTMSFDGLENATYDQLSSAEFKKLLDEKKAEAMEMLKPIGFSGTYKYRQNLETQVNLGVKYEMPFYRQLAVGATGRYINTVSMPYWEGRLGLEINPIKWLDIVADGGYGTLGPVFGLAAGVTIYRFHLVAGLQNGFGGTVPYSSTPIKANFKTVTIGLTYNL